MNSRSSGGRRNEFDDADTTPEVNARANDVNRAHRCVRAHGPDYETFARIPRRGRSITRPEEPTPCAGDALGARHVARNKRGVPDNVPEEGHSMKAAIGLISLALVIAGAAHADPLAPEVTAAGRTPSTTIGVSVGLGGGVTNYVNGDAMNATEVGGAYEVRATIGTRLFLAGEVAYAGSARGVNTGAVSGQFGGSPHIYSNGIEGAVRAQYPLRRQRRRLQPAARLQRRAGCSVRSWRVRCLERPLHREPLHVSAGLQRGPRQERERRQRQPEQLDRRRAGRVRVLIAGKRWSIMVNVGQR